MTEDEIREMEAGRQMDTLIAKHVMGTSVPSFPGQNPRSLWDEEDLWLAMHKQFPFSTDIAAAWQVVEKMTPIDYGFSLNIESPPGPWGNWEANFYNGGDHYAHGDTVSLAICRSALLAKMEDAK